MRYPIQKSMGPDTDVVDMIEVYIHIQLKLVAACISPSHVKKEDEVVEQENGESLPDQGLDDGGKKRDVRKCN